MSKAKDLSELGGVIVTDGSGNVGIGTSSPARDLSIGDGTGSPNIQLLAANTGNSRLEFGDTDDSDVGEIQYLHTDNAMLFHVNGSERLRIDNSGNVLVGKTSADNGVTAGIELRGDIDKLYVTDFSSSAIICNRLSSDGAIANFQKDGTTVGSLRSSFGSLQIDNAGNYLSLVSGSANREVVWDAAQSGGTWRAGADNTSDIGYSARRWDDIYATNGTIQTSDQNEKQQIDSLTSAEITAAKAISKLFKTFKWNDKVEAKGDAARTHTGVIAQDVQQAMTDAGLNAGDYAFFISATWWETQTEVPAVEDADAYTRTDTYDTAEEAPEGATERTRLGIRYPELLAFVGAATEQRLASIETRLTALEIE